MKYPSRLEIKLAPEQKEALNQLAEELGYETTALLFRAIANKQLIVTRS